MNLTNATNVQADWTLAFQQDGREILIVVVKATFDLQNEYSDPVLSAAQVPLTEADEFTGEPGFSATLHETDFAHLKPKCDVLLNGSAYALQQVPRETVRVGLSVADMNKAFAVIGDRVWDHAFMAIRASAPEPFVKKKVSFDTAYGGSDTHPSESGKTETYLRNPVGVGFYPYTSGRGLLGKPLPNTEEIDHFSSSTHKNICPMSFGAVGRNFDPRYKYAGTYDKAWLENQAPFFPRDFQYQYFQAAPEDQQIRYPRGGEVVRLLNLTPNGKREFRLPTLPVPVLVIQHRAVDRSFDPKMDTILIEPDEGRICLTWRAVVPLKRNCFEIKELIVGEMPREWHRARQFAGKPYYKSLDAFIRAKGKNRGWARN